MNASTTGINVSVPTSSTTRQRSCAGYASTSATVPSTRPDSVRTVHPVAS